MSKYKLGGREGTWLDLWEYNKGEAFYYTPPFLNFHEASIYLWTPGNGTWGDYKRIQCKSVVSNSRMYTYITAWCTQGIKYD